MNLKIKYRTPTDEHTTMVLNDVEIEITTQEYISIIKPASFATDGPSYMKHRFNLINSYFENINSEPKEQFSW
jgi:hypothetical protein